MNELTVNIALASVILAVFGWVILGQRPLRKAIEALEGRQERRFETYNARVNKRFDQVDARIDKRFDQVDARIDKRFDRSDARIDKRFDQVDKRFDRSDEQIGETNGRIDGLRSELNDRDTQLRTETTAHVTQLRRALDSGFKVVHERLGGLHERFSKVESVVEVLRDYLFGRARSSSVRRSGGTRVAAQGLPPKKDE